ncbi:hypothetical protein [Clostridiisalibacter paucivorans]|uniref:hypothetical protein n=1 Tax=Clostridiisalibacter paucivorans TaxID=408753 RepID=UPI00047A85C6|nr:hypothetical protein [Clostridiisalibacter paucivorans]
MEKTFFSDFFNVDKYLMKKYGAFDISLISDTPAFIDPFLLYSNNKAVYKKAHEDMIEYIKFLCRKAEEAKNDASIQEKYYFFKEPKQNWLGYTLYGNSGNGLKNEFAKEVCINASDYIKSFGQETITNSSHMEKLCLFSEGHGLDNVSDFTTSLIKPFLLDFTEKFCVRFLKESQCKQIMIENAYFDFREEEWKAKEYYLPVFNNDFVLLVPEDILVKGDNFISRKNFIEDLRYSRISIEDSKFRDHINEYISEIINGDFTAAEVNRKIDSLAKQYPELIDYYIKSKEDNSSEAINNNKELIKEFDLLFDTNCNALINLLRNRTGFYNMKDIDNTSAIKKRLSQLKYVIEELGGNKYLYINNKGINIKFLEILFNRIWFAGRPKINQKRNVDYILEFKEVFNSPVEKNIINRFVNNNKESKNRILCYVYYNEREYEIVTESINKYDLCNNANIVIINAMKDFKQNLFAQ